MPKRRTRIGIRATIIAAVSLAMMLGVGLQPAMAQTKVTLEVVINAWHDNVLSAIQEGAERFAALNPGVTVEVTRRGTWDDFIVRVVGGTPPDVVTVASQQAAEYGRGGLIIPIDQLVAQTNLRSQVFGPMWSNFEWDGKTYAVPGIETGARLGMVWNSAMVGEAGLFVDPNSVLTWEEFFDYADKLTRIDADGRVIRIGYDPLNGQNSRLFTIAPLFGTEWLNYATGMPHLDSDALIAGLELIVDRVFRRYPTFTGAGDWYAIASEKVAVTNLGIYAPGEIRSRNPNMQFMVGWPPHVEGKRVQQVICWGLGIPAGAKNPELSMRLIEFLATDLEFQMNLYNKSGFLGAGLRFMDAAPRRISDESILWYMSSLYLADVLDAPRPHPITDRAASLFAQQVNNIYKLTVSPRAVLSEANRQLIVQMREEGLLK